MDPINSHHSVQTLEHYPGDPVKDFTSVEIWSEHSDFMYYKVKTKDWDSNVPLWVRQDEVHSVKDFTVTNLQETRLLTGKDV